MSTRKPTPRATLPDEASGATAMWTDVPPINNRLNPTINRIRKHVHEYVRAGENINGIPIWECGCGLARCRPDMPGSTA